MPRSDASAGPFAERRISTAAAAAEALNRDSTGTGRVGRRQRVRVDLGRDRVLTAGGQCGAGRSAAFDQSDRDRAEVKVVDDRAGIQYGENGEDPVYIDLIYMFDISDNLRFSTSVVNLFDRDPPKYEIEYGYDARLGSSLGRTIEFGIKANY